MECLNLADYGWSGELRSAKIDRVNIMPEASGEWVRLTRPGSKNFDLEMHYGIKNGWEMSDESAWATLVY